MRRIARAGFVPEAVLRTNPAVAAVRDEVNAVTSCHDALVLSSNTRYAALLPDGDSGAAAAGAGPGVAGSGVASGRFARSG